MRTPNIGVIGVDAVISVAIDPVWGRVVEYTGTIIRYDRAANFQIGSCLRIDTIGSVPADGRIVYRALKRAGCICKGNSRAVIAADGVGYGDCCRPATAASIDHNPHKIAGSDNMVDDPVRGGGTAWRQIIDAIVAIVREGCIADPKADRTGGWLHQDAVAV